MAVGKEFIVEPGSKVRLDKIDPAFKGKHESHEQAMPEIAKHVARMDQLQYLIYADGDQSLLVVLQALDAGGKDGVVRHLFSGMNPQGTTSVGFKQPSKLEAAHDFLWRAHLRAPGKGELVIFNRSHYEDVLVVRVNLGEMRGEMARQIVAGFHCDSICATLRRYLHRGQSIRRGETRYTPGRQEDFFQLRRMRVSSGGMQTDSWLNDPVRVSPGASFDMSSAWPLRWPPASSFSTLAYCSRWAVT